MSEIIEIECKKYGFGEDCTVYINKSHITFVEMSSDYVVVDVIERGGIEFRDKLTESLCTCYYVLGKSGLDVLKTKLG